MLIFVLERPSEMHLLHRLVNVINLVCSLPLSPLKQCLSESEFYGDLVYKFRKYFRQKDFSDQLKKSLDIKVLDTTYMLCDRVHAYATECMLGG